MPKKQEISGCIDCHEVYYPDRFRACECNGKYPLVYEVESVTAEEIERLRKNGAKHVKLIEGKLISSYGSVHPPCKGTPTAKNEPDSMG